MDPIISNSRTSPVEAFKQIMKPGIDTPLTKVDMLSNLKFEKDIAKFKEQDTLSPPPQKSVVFVGSSSIRQWNSLEFDFPKYSVIKRGFGGSHMCDALYYINDIVTPYKPRAVVIYEGDNDLSKKKSPDLILAQYKQFCRLIHEQYPSCPVLFIAVKASTARWDIKDNIIELNYLISDWSSEDQRIGFADVFYPMLNDRGEPDPKFLVEDGLHMTPLGYQLWTQIVTNELKRLLE